MILNLLIPSIVSKIFLYVLYHHNEFIPDTECNRTIWLKIYCVTMLMFMPFFMIYSYFIPTKRITRHMLFYYAIAATCNFSGYTFSCIAIILKYYIIYMVKCHIEIKDIDATEFGICMFYVFTYICYSAEVILFLLCIYKKYQNDKNEALHEEIHDVNHLKDILIV